MSKVKVKKLMSNDVDQEMLTGLFEQMTGMKDADTNVILPKYIKVMVLLKKINKLYNLLINLDVFTTTFSDYVWIDEIKMFCDDIKQECGLDVNEEYKEDAFRYFLHNKFSKKEMTPAEIEMDKHIKNNTSSDAEINKYLNKLYKTVKNSNTIKKIMITSSNLGQFKGFLSAENVSDIFIHNYPGNTFIPLAFTTMDLKLIWYSDIEPKGKKFILTILQHTFKISYEIYDIIYSPDIDISEFSDILISTISKLRSQIPRCDKAFDVIENSVNMLKNNFKDYFRESVETENPSSILQSFIIDVGNTQKANPVVVGQFRKITAFMKRNAANSTDPNVKKLFKMLNNQFNAIDKEMKVDTRSPEENDVVDKDFTASHGDMTGGDANSKNTSTTNEITINNLNKEE